MALIHIAYSFDAKLFNYKLQSEVAKNNILDLRKMHQIAVDAVKNMDGSTKKALLYLRYDDDWIDTTDEEVSHSHQWYLLALTKYFTPVTSLSHRIPNSYSMLSKILPMIGWNEEEVKLIITGNPLSTLVADSHNALFTSEFSAGIDQYGGWLSLEKITILLDKLERGKLELQTIMDQGSERLIIDDKVLVAYNNALEMLNLSYNRGHSLFLLLDY